MEGCVSGAPKSVAEPIEAKGLRGNEVHTNGLTCTDIRSQSSSGIVSHDVRDPAECFEVSSPGVKSVPRAGNHSALGMCDMDGERESCCLLPQTSPFPGADCMRRLGECAAKMEGRKQPFHHQERACFLGGNPCK